MCHQVVEKALKGYYSFTQSDNPPYIHNLTILAERAGIYDTLNDKQLDLIDLLEPLNIEARYPSHKEMLLKTLSSERCSKIILETEELLLWIKNKLLKKP